MKNHIRQNGFYIFSDLMKDYLNKNVVEEVGIVNYSEVAKLLCGFYDGKDFLYARVWLLIVLHKWFKDNKIFLS